MEKKNGAQQTGETCTESNEQKNNRERVNRSTSMSLGYEANLKMGLKLGQKVKSIGSSPSNGRGQRQEALAGALHLRK